MVIRILFVLFLFLVIYVARAFVSPIPHRNSLASLENDNKKPLYGVSYSFEQAGWFGLDPRSSYTKLLDEFDFDWVRLSFYWDKYNFDDLKFAIREAAKRDVDVIVALGAKTPYFPEYKWPSEIKSRVKFGDTIDLKHPVAGDIVEIDKSVVRELSSFDNIIFWQVENEPLIGNVNRWKIDPTLVAAEVEVVRKTDPKKRPIILNHAATGFYDKSWQELLPILAPGDVFAVNAFFKTKGTDLFNAKIFGKEIHILWPDHFVWPVYPWGIFSPNFAQIKSTVEANGNRFWVLEMQAEPYIKKLDEAQDRFLSFNTGDIADAEGFLRSYKIESVGFWGVHFWLFREMLGDESWTRAVNEIVSQ